MQTATEKAVGKPLLGPITSLQAEIDGSLKSIVAVA